MIPTVEVEEVPEVKEPELPIIPNYLSNPPFMYSKLDNKSEVITDQHATQNGTRGCEEDSEPASLPPTLEAQDPHGMLPDPPAALPNPSPHRAAHASDLLPVAEQNGASPGSSSSHNHAAVNCTVPMDLSVEPHLINHADYQHVAPARNGAMCSPPLSSASSGGGGGAVPPPVAGAHPTMSRQQSIPQQLGHGPSGGAVPAFQPFFFTSTFPVNVQGETLVSFIIRTQRQRVQIQEALKIQKTPKGARENDSKRFPFKSKLSHTHTHTE